MSLKTVRAELAAWGKYQRFAYYENGYPRVNILCCTGNDEPDEEWLARIEATEASVNRLSAECKSVINGKYVRMMSVQKISRWLSMPVRSVEFRLLQGENSLL